MTLIQIENEFIRAVESNNDELIIESTISLDEIESHLNQTIKSNNSDLMIDIEPCKDGFIIEIY